MIYKKDPKIKYWEMAKYIDDHVREADCDEQLIFEYMYHLFYVLSVKAKMFKCGSDYDNYALYGATQLFVRYRKENINPNLKPIKSSLNYIKKLLYPIRVDYQQANFAEMFTQESLDSSPDQLRLDAISKARSLNSDMLSVDYKYCLSQANATVKKVLSTSPYKKQPDVLHSLYLSCMLTLLKCLTISNKNQLRLDNKISKNLSVDTLLDQIYAAEIQDDVVVFHLDKSMRNYVDTLVKRIKHEMAKDLKYLIGSYELSDESLRDILASPMGDCNPTNNNPGRDY